jgi:hypothetical protein
MRKTYPPVREDVVHGQSTCRFFTKGKKDEKKVAVNHEVCHANTKNNGVFWDVTPCGSCKNRRFGGT